MHRSMGQANSSKTHIGEGSMIGTYDPDGALHEHQLRLARKDSYHAILLAVGFICAFIVCAVFVTLDLIGR